MLKHTFSAIVFAAAVAFSLGAVASEGGDLPSAQTNIRDTASLQRGASLFVNYCSGCHSLKYLRYSRMAEDLGLGEQDVTDNLLFTQQKFGEPMLTSMSREDAAKWFGAAPPDLSLEVRAKGADWVYNYLRSFYIDPSRPVGWNNTVFPNASMPNVLWSLQGIQVVENAEEGTLKLQQPGSMTPAEFDGAARDITAFLEYAAEPAALQRHSMGVWVLLYLAMFTLLAYLLKREFWKDVH